MLNGQFPPQMLPPGSPADRVPGAPPGTIVVLGAEGGYAVPPRRYTLLFGRDREGVHVPVGADDPVVSRKHGVFTCTGHDGGWWLRNTGRLPIELLDGALILTGHEMLMESGYTTLIISSSRHRSHLVEVRVVSGNDQWARATADVPTADPDVVYELAPQERLVLTALGRRYLEGHDSYPLPLTWEQTAEVANASPYSFKTWTEKSAANAVARVRDRLHQQGVHGLTREEVGEQVGTTLSHNLIRELIKTVTLEAQDLELLAQQD
jgi:hypothetical protein